MRLSRCCAAAASFEGEIARFDHSGVLSDQFLTLLEAIPARLDAPNAGLLTRGEAFVRVGASLDLVGVALLWSAMLPARSGEAPAVKVVTALSNGAMIGAPCGAPISP